MLKQAITKLGLSARAYDRILIVATILVTLHMTTSLRLEAGPKTRVCEGEGGSRGLYRWSP